MSRQMDELFYCKHIETLMAIVELVAEVIAEDGDSPVATYRAERSFQEWYETLIDWSNEFEEQFADTENFIEDIEQFTLNKIKAQSW